LWDIELEFDLQYMKEGSCIQMNSRKMVDKRLF